MSSRQTEKKPARIRYFDKPAIPGFLLLLLLGQLGCNGGDDSDRGGGTPTTYACNFSSECVESTNNSALNSFCSAVNSGTLSAASCSTISYVGICTAGSFKYYYYSASFDLTAAQSDCTSLGGSFATGNVAADGTISSFQRCDKIASASACVSYTGSGWTSAVETVCTGGGDSLASSCSTSNGVGSCRVPNATNLELVWFFYSSGGAPYNAMTAQNACTGLGGTFSP